MIGVISVSFDKGVSDAVQEGEYWMEN